MKLHRVRRFPSVLEGREANCIYLEKVPGETYFNFYVTGNSPDIFSQTAGVQEIENTVARFLSSNAGYELVSNIELRDRFKDEGKFKSKTMVLVEDATGDPNFQGAGGMAYLYDPETEVFTPAFRLQLDPDAEVTWDIIRNRPRSSVEEIDDAVILRHVHHNHLLLDELSTQDVVGGTVLTFQGRSVGNPVVQFPDW